VDANLAQPPALDMGQKFDCQACGQGQ